MKLIDAAIERTIKVQRRNRPQIENPLFNLWKKLMNMIGKVNHADRKDGVAGKAHVENALTDEALRFTRLLELHCHTDHRNVTISKRVKLLN